MREARPNWEATRAKITGRVEKLAKLFAVLEKGITDAGAPELAKKLEERKQRLVFIRTLIDDYSLHR